MIMVWDFKVEMKVYILIFLELHNAISRLNQSVSSKLSQALRSYTPHTVTRRGCRGME